MDKAPDFGSGDCRFESCQGRILFVACGIGMDEGSTGLYIEGGGPTHAARSKTQYNSAFATRVLQSTYLYVKEETA
jgi:hypothetical protein